MKFSNKLFYLNSIQSQTLILQKKFLKSSKAFYLLVIGIRVHLHEVIIATKTRARLQQPHFRYLLTFIYN